MKMQNIALSKITANETLNPREVYDIEPLYASILQTGLDTPLYVSSHKEGYTVLRGYRRFRALKQLEKQNPDAFNKHFKKGVPCMVFSGLTEPEEVELRLDHSNSKPLDSELEIFRTVKFYMQLGKTERDIALLMDGLLANRIKASAIPKRNKALSVPDLSERSRLLLSVWKGRLEPFTRATKLPDEIIQRFERSIALDSDIPDSERLSKSDIKALYTAHLKDITVSEQDSNVPRPTKAEPGEHYREAERQLYAEKLAPKATKEVKRRSAETVKNYRSQFSSKLAHGLFDWIAGKDVHGLVGMDKDSTMVEVLKKSNKPLYDSVLEWYMDETKVTPKKTKN